MLGTWCLRSLRRYLVTFGSSEFKSLPGRIFSSLRRQNDAGGVLRRFLRVAGFRSDYADTAMDLPSEPALVGPAGLGIVVDRGLTRAGPSGTGRGRTAGSDGAAPRARARVPSGRRMGHRRTATPAPGAVAPDHHTSIDHRSSATKLFR